MSPIKYSKPDKIDLKNDSSRKPVKYQRTSTYPYHELLDSRSFEILLYHLFSDEIASGSLDEFDEIRIMSGIKDKGRDCTLHFEGKNTGVIQCKRYEKDITKQQLGEEVIKFIFYSLVHKELISDENNFHYYFAVSKDFEEDASSLLINWKNQILDEKNLDKWIDNVYKFPEITKGLKDKNKATDDLKNRLNKIKINKLTSLDIDRKLNANQAIVDLFFSVDTVVREEAVLTKLKNLEDRLQTNLKNIEDRLQELTIQEKNNFNDIAIKKQKKVFEKYQNQPENVSEIELIYGLCSDSLELKIAATSVSKENNVINKVLPLILDNLQNTNKHLIMSSLEALSGVKGLDYESISTFLKSNDTEIKQEAFITLFSWGIDTINKDNIKDWLYWLEYEADYIREYAACFLRSLTEKSKLNFFDISDDLIRIVKKEKVDFIKEDIFAILKNIPKILEILDFDKLLLEEQHEIVRYECLQALFFENCHDLVGQYMVNFIKRNNDLYCSMLRNGLTLCIFSDNKHCKDAIAEFHKKYPNEKLESILGSFSKPERIIPMVNSITPLNKDNKHIRENIEFQAFLNKYTPFLILVDESKSSIKRKSIARYLENEENYYVIDYTDMTPTNIVKSTIHFKKEDRIVMILPPILNNELDNLMLWILERGIVNTGINSSEKNAFPLRDKASIVFLAHESDFLKIVEKRKKYWYIVKCIFD